MTSTPTRPVDNVVIATKGLQDRNTNIIAGTTVEYKGKLILILTDIPKGKRLLENRRHGYIRIYIKEIGFNAWNGIDSAQRSDY